MQPADLTATSDQLAMFGDGNDAIAWAAQDAGVDYVSHYPGSPVNRVVDVLQAGIEKHGCLINHALNEHIAALSVMGASLCGARSLLVMKHVGLNIAADPLNYAGQIKIKGGLVIVVGTDPGARSSTGEEDVHWYAPQFNFPLLEPVDLSHLYQGVVRAFELSEQVQLPVLVFTPGRLAYQSGLITRQAAERPSRRFNFHKDQQNLINVGARAVRNHRHHIERLRQFQQQNDTSTMHYNADASYGIVTRGASHTICREVIESLGLESRVHLLNYELTHPLNIDPFLDFAANKSEIVVVEDQDGFLETMLKREAFGRVNCRLEGKRHFPPWGEISDKQLREFFADHFDLQLSSNSLPLEFVCPERPGSFCEGCPHRPSFYAIDKALEEIARESGSVGVIGGDIGCSSLPPHRTDWLLCMNAGVGMAQGMAHLLPEQPILSTGGEGSLFHGGLTSLQSAVENGIKLTHILFDNQAIAMTGHQPSPTAQGRVDLRSLLLGIGVSDVLEVNPFAPTAMATLIKQTLGKQGVKVIHVQGRCALQPTEEALRRLKERRLELNNALCGECRECYQALQCPAIGLNADSGELHIDMNRCRRCAACLDVCPNDAIEVTDPLYHG
ncbi:MAG: thiamine pyrophosphate-dependent enzyme [Candidatus Thiodiazotropha sp.]